MRRRLAGLGEEGGVAGRGGVVVVKVAVADDHADRLGRPALGHAAWSIPKGKTVPPPM